jgi:hypothetical protein
MAEAAPENASMNNRGIAKIGFMVKLLLTLNA